MSRENVEKFYLMAQKDEQLKSELKKVDSKYQGNNITKAVLPALIEKEILPLAKKRGLDFSTDELMKYLEEKVSGLSTDELRNVSGGISPKKAALGLSGALLLSIGAGAGTYFIAKNIDNHQGQKMEQQIERKGKPERHEFERKGPEREKSGEDRDDFKDHEKGEDNGKGKDDLKNHKRGENRDKGKENLEKS